MKKLLIMFLGFFAFACGGSTDNGRETDANATENDATVPEEVEIGAGEQRSPQLEFETDSNEIFDVDTVSSAREIDEQIEQ